MRKQILLLALSGIVTASFATVTTVNNNPNSIAQFTILQHAIDSSSVGDSIYVIGSPTSYGNISITTKLVLIGAGYAVTGTPYNYNTSIGTITIDSINGGTQVSGLRLKGLWITGGIYSGTNTTFAKPDITFERCRIDGSITVLGNGWSFNGNLINSGIVINNFLNIIISNNVIYGYISNSNNATVLITNNDFITSSYGGLVTVTNALITNNIFFQIGSFYSTTQNNTFNKNIAYNSTTVVTLPPASNTGSGNQSNTNPKLTNVPSNSSTYYETTYDYHLASGSPAISAGTDGKDLGIYGGTNPIANITGVTNLPQITLFNISNSVLLKNGTLNVNVKAREQN
jgi:hypothetical protein